MQVQLTWGMSWAFLYAHSLVCSIQIFLAKLGIKNF